MQQIEDILNGLSEDAAANDEVIRLYKEYQLRQKITLKDQVKDIFKFEKEKNDLIFNIFEGEEKRLRFDLADKYEMLHSGRMLLLKMTRETEDLEADSDSCRALKMMNKTLMHKRKRELSHQNSLQSLRSIGILKSAGIHSHEIHNTSQDKLDIELLSPGRASRESLEHSDTIIKEQDADIFENDPAYLKLKQESAKATLQISSTCLMTRKPLEDPRT